MLCNTGAFIPAAAFAASHVVLCGFLQALGLEVRSVLAIGGIGGLAIGLAGREICENLLNGMLLMTTVSCCWVEVLALWQMYRPYERFLGVGIQQQHPTAAAATAVGRWWFIVYPRLCIAAQRHAAHDHGELLLAGLGHTLRQDPTAAATTAFPR
jgi:hypothetical protein